MHQEESNTVALTRFARVHLLLAVQVHAGSLCLDAALLGALSQRLTMAILEHAYACANCLSNHRLSVHCLLFVVQVHAGSLGLDAALVGSLSQQLTMQEALAVAAGRQLAVSALVSAEAAGTQPPLMWR
jgi:hypothetical protein